MAKKVERFYIHSTHCKYGDDPLRNAVVVKEEVCTIEDGKETWTPHLNIMRDPERLFYITLPQFRNHQFKKEFEDKSRLETFRCHDSELKTKLAQALGLNPWKYKYASIRELCSSPYVYGADIDTETLIKQWYLKHQPAGKSAHYTAGAFDIETEVVGEKRINVITFIHERQVYTAALKDFCNIYNKEANTFKPATEQDCLKVIDETIGDNLRENKFELHFTIQPTELDLIKWIFARIHECKTDIIGIWNLDFDIPKVIERITALGAKPEDIFCPPDLPKELRYCKYNKDTGLMAQHITDKWHWLNCTGYSQFIDSMCLYARLRKVDGRDISYTLDYISTKELGQGKLHFGAITNHRLAQTYDFLHYIAYNINDVVIMQLMEFKNHDIYTLLGLSDCSLLRNFNKQTIMVRDGDYVYAQEHNHVPASAGTTSFTKWDNEMTKVGGTVLPPEKAIGVGIQAVKGVNTNTQVNLFVNDLDESSMYPSSERAFNVSKESYYGTVLHINGYDNSLKPVYGASLSHPDAYALQVMETFYSMPGYKEMDELFKDYLNKQGKS